MNSSLRYQIALTQFKGVGTMVAKNLIAYLGSAEAVFTEPLTMLRKIPRAGAAIVDEQQRRMALQRADAELEFITKHAVEALFYTDSAYPYRLKECADCPVILYSIGNTSLLNVSRLMAVVGTRKATDYGKQLCEQLVADVALLPNSPVVVSGLAYGIDALAHRAAMTAGVPTIGVLAHGLDMIYPAQHRALSEKIINQGGILLSEYISHTIPEPSNFVQRNRIIAGLCDCTVVVESAERGGALLTAAAANEYNRDVLTFPGRTTDPYSAGCNALISGNQATLISSAADLEGVMGWTSSNRRTIEQPLFDELTEIEQEIIEILHREPLHLDMLSRMMKLPVQKMSPLLVQMEFKGLIKALPGQRYKV
ncbi:MAG: DNA-processing protein DprA [Prevotellaceae bacterium]|jgi:DNA processing protein|nr:DNA-processing protein DprA [Prevotellaceae bacterium]